jgi:hypothetical protein
MIPFLHSHSRAQNIKAIQFVFLYTFFTLFCLPSNAFAHEGKMKGTILDSSSGKPVVFALVTLEGKTDPQHTNTDESGGFVFRGLEEGDYSLSVVCLGYKPRIFHFQYQDANSGNTPILIKLSPKSLDLTEITITGSKDLRQAMNTIDHLDMQLRPVNSAQDLLRLVPGLFIAQHQGGGKAEQIFLRGFDADHGTDFAVLWDGIQVNMPSHAHGQGYSDLHFVMPETIEQLNVYKGTYSTRFGDFCTSGAGEFLTKNYAENSISVEYGQYNSHRVMGLLNLLGKEQHLFSKKKESLYIAAEDNYNEASYFTNHQNYQRFNTFLKYYGLLSDKTSLSITGSYFGSTWNGSGQIPERAISEGLITRFGSLDPSEGGQTNRTNANVILKTELPTGGILKNQVYYSYYQFNLFTNFHFFLNDTVHGDGINQREKGRNVWGYNGSLEKDYDLKGHNLKSIVGIGTRLDMGETSLRHQMLRTVLDTIVIGNLFEQNGYAYLDETYQVTNRFFVNAGIRADYFYFQFHELRKAYDSLSGQTQKLRFSPKLNFTYNLNENTQLFIRSGIGYHSNDARAIVTNAHENTLPYAVGYEGGSLFRPFPKLIVSAVLWSLYLQNELTYSGDDGTVAINGPSQRYGVDLSFRYQLSKILFADLDLNYSHGRFVDLPEGQNRIPLAPALTSTAGLSLKTEKGFGASLRYRFIDDRPANGDNTIVAKGYFLLDAIIRYKISKYEVALKIENILNAEWNEAQFETVTRLKGEPVGGIDQLCFTPGAPRIVKASLTYRF